jgi:hypothetical protein
MAKYVCEHCEKEFSQKGSYTRHINKKTHCISSSESSELTKKQFGQFYTTNYAYILQNMYIPDSIIDIVEPFAGNGDLLNFIDKDKDKDKYNIECYDIDPKKDYIIKQDTILNPPNLDEKFIITNPPYLARNKCNDKTLFDKYNTNDLYKCFIQILIHSNCKGGIIIIPLNFLSSIRKSDVELREKFITKYNVIIINIFEEQVFDDTTYTTCSIQFELKCDTNEHIINCYIYPQKVSINFVLNSQNNYTIGGEIYNLKQNSMYKVDRATKLFDSQEYFTNILVKCIDDNIDSKLGLSIVNDTNKNKYIDNTPNLTARSYAILVIEPKLNIEQQTQLVNKFNLFINKNREKYYSLFLTNYRESNTIARKRISFSLVYEICNYLLNYSE